MTLVEFRAYEAMLVDYAGLLEMSDHLGDNVLGNDLREVAGAILKAAERIKALEAENMRLREAVESLEARATLAAGVLGKGGPKFRHVQISFDILANIARAALSSEPKQEQSTNG